MFRFGQSSVTASPGRAKFKRESDAHVDKWI